MSCFWGLTYNGISPEYSNLPTLCLACQSFSSEKRGTLRSWQHTLPKTRLFPHTFLMTLWFTVMINNAEAPNNIASFTCTTTKYRDTEVDWMSISLSIYLPTYLSIYIYTYNRLFFTFSFIHLHPQGSDCTQAWRDDSITPF